MDFKMGPIPREKKRGWRLAIDGKEVESSMLELSSKFGTLLYGLRPEGYDAWVFAETAGGGAVTIPYAFTDGKELLVGLLPEKRANMGGERLCLVGGFVDPGEKHRDAAVREASQEAGITFTSAELPGLPLNANRAFFVADPDAGEGLHCYAVHVHFAMLTHVEGRDWRIDSEYADAEALGKAKHVVFMPWHQAVQRTADAIAVAAIARLMAALSENGLFP